MSRANPVLTIVVAEEWERSPEVAALRDAGHRVFGYHEPSPAEPDLILHPAAHWWSEDMWPYLPAALTAARKRRKERNASA